MATIKVKLKKLKIYEKLRWKKILQFTASGVKQVLNKKKIIWTTYVDVKKCLERFKFDDHII